MAGTEMTEFAPQDPDYQAVVKASFARQGLMQALGIELVELAPGRCVLEVSADSRLSQQHGYFHGALIGAALDCASGYAALSLMPPASDVLTTEYKINFVAAAEGERLIARGRVIKVWPDPHRMPGRGLLSPRRRGDAVRRDAAVPDSHPPAGMRPRSAPRPATTFPPDQPHWSAR